MAGICMSFARLSQEKYERVRQLEQELGTPIIAVEERCHWSSLDEDKLRKLQEAERELGVVLLAYEQDEE